MDNPSQLLRLRDLDLGDNMTIGWVGDKLELTLGAKAVLDSESQVFPLAASQGRNLFVSKLGRNEYARGVRIDDSDGQLPIVILTKTEFYALPERDPALYILIPQYPDGAVTQSKLFIIPERDTVPVGGKVLQAYVDTDPDDDWALSADVGITVTPLSGTGPGLVTVTVPATESPTSQSFQLTATCGGLTAGYTVLQAGGGGVETMTATPNSLTFTNTYGEQYTTTVTVEPTAAPWAVLSKSPWVAVFPSSGASGDPVRIMCAFNGSETERTGFVDFCKKGYPDMHVILTLTQAGNDNSITVPATLALDAVDGAQTFQLTTQGTSAWELVTPLPAWLTLSAETGPNSASITATATDNTGAERDIALTFRLVDYPEVTDTITITQATDVTVIDISPATWTPGFAYGEQEFTITVTGAWSITKPEWMTLSAVTGTFDPQTLTGSGNATILGVVLWNGLARTGTIELTALGGTDSVAVSQPGGSAGISFDPETWAAPAAGGTQEIVVLSSGNWAFATLPGGISADVSSGTVGRHVITLTATENATLDDAAERHVTATVGAITADLTITQESVPGITMTPTLGTIQDGDWVYASTTTGELVNVKVYPKTASWTGYVLHLINEEPVGWAAVEAPGTGTGDGQFNMDWLENETTSQYMARVRVIDNAGTPHSYEAPIVQLGIAETATLTETIVYPTATGADYSLHVTSNVAVDISCTGTGFSILPTTHAAGNYVPTLTTSNNYGAQNEGTVVIKKSGTQTVLASGVIYQDATSIALSSNTASPGYSGGEVTVDVTVVPADAGWTAVSNSAWCTIDTDGTPLTKSGTGSTSGMPITVAANSGAERAATVTFTRITGVTTVLTLTQAALGTISISPTTTQAFAADGEDIEFAVTANGPWTATTGGNFSIVTGHETGTGNGHTLVRAAANTSASNITDGELTVTRDGGSVNDTCTLTQVKIALTSISPTSWADATAVEDTQEITVTAVGVWQINQSTLPAWITASAYSGTGNGSTTLTVAANTGAARDGNVRFQMTNDTAHYIDLHVDQASGEVASTISLASYDDIASPYTNWPYPPVNPPDWGAISGTTPTVGNAGSIKVTSSGAWTASASTGITITASSGSTGANVGFGCSLDNTQDREGTITFTCGTATAVLTVIFKAGQDLWFYGDYSIPGLIMDRAILGLIQTSGAWTTAITEGGAWLTTQSPTGTGNAYVWVSTAANTTNAVRKGCITATRTSDGKSAKMYIYQQPQGKAGTMNCVPQEITLNEANSWSASVTASNMVDHGAPGSWYAIWSNVYNSDGLLKVNGNVINTDRAIINGTNTFTRAFAQAAGSGTVTKHVYVSPFWTGEYIGIYPIVVNLVAEAVGTVTVSPETDSVAATADSTVITVSGTNGAWTAAANQTWAHLSKTSGTTDDTITVTFDDNAGTGREVTVTVTRGSGPSSQDTCVITQAAAAGLATLLLIPQQMWGTSIPDVDNGGSTSTFVICDGNWTTACLDQYGTPITWLHAPASGTGTGTVTITADAGVGSMQYASVRFYYGTEGYYAELPVVLGGSEGVFSVVERGTGHYYSSASSGVIDGYGYWGSVMMEDLIGAVELDYDYPGQGWTYFDWNTSTRVAVTDTVTEVFYVHPSGGGSSS